MKNAIKRVATEVTDLSSGKSQTSIRLEVSPDLIRGGFIKEIGGAKHFAVLMAIVAHSNAMGTSYPSQDKIGAILGMTRQTVSKVIADLLEVEIDGKHLISRERTKSGEYQNNVYTYMADKTVEAPADRLFKSSLEVIRYFEKVYHDTFGEIVNINYSRDTGLVKQKLYNRFTDEQIKSIIDVGVGKYVDNWYTSKYPRPTVYMLCDWLGNKALAMASVQAKTEAELQERMNRDTTAEEEVASRYI